MAYAITLSALGILLIIWAGSLSGWFWLLSWLGVNLILLGLAHASGHHRLYSKRADGTLPLWSRLLHLPLLLVTWATWHLYRLSSREAAWHEITPKLVIGRRLIPRELPGEFSNYIDLTTEFEESLPHRESPGYQAVPMLDGSALPAEALLAAVQKLKPGRTFVHCAQGHGRTGLFAVAVLLHQGTAKTVAEALALLREKRPLVRLNDRQKAVVEQFLILLKSSVK